MKAYIRELIGDELMSIRAIETLKTSNGCKQENI